MNEELKIIISAEIDKLKKGMSDAKKQMKGFVDDAKSGLEKLGKVAKDVASAIGDGLKKAVDIGVKAVGGMATATVGVVEMTQEMRNEQAKLVTAFENAGSSAEQAKTTYNDLYRVIGDSGVATEASAHLAQLTQDQKSLSEWTNICQGVYATFGDSLPIESLTEASNETAKTGQLTGALADALNWAGVNEDKFQESLEKCNSEAEREQLIRETLNGLYDDASKKFEETNSQVLAENEAQAKLNDTLMAVGDALAPVVTWFKELATEALELVLPYIQQLADEWLPVLQEKFGSVEEVVGRVKDAIQLVVDKIVEWKDNLTTGFENATAWVQEHKTAFELLAIAIAGVTTALLIYNGASILAMAQSALETVAIYGLIVAEGIHTTASTIAAGATTAFGAAMAFLTSPITLVILAITAVIAIIYLLIKNWDTVKEVAIKCWDGIVEGVKSAWEWIKNILAPVGQWFKNLWEGIKNTFSKVGSTLSGFFKSAWDGIKSAWGSVTGWFSNIWNKIKSTFSSVQSTLKGYFSGAWNAIKSVFSNWGTFFTGLWNKIKSIFTNVGQAVASAISGTVKGAINSVLSGAVRIINGFIGAINLAISVINAIPGVSISKLSKLSVPKLAKGGIVDKATLAVVGEQGREAVMPLENNTQWIDDLAEKLAERVSATSTNGNQTIVMQVDGKTFGEVAINTINTNTKQTGKLGLKLY